MTAARAGRPRLAIRWRTVAIAAAMALVLGLVCSSPVCAQDLWLRFDPDFAVIEEGEEIEVAILIEDANDLYGIEFDIVFDPVVLQVVDVNPDIAGIQLELGTFPYPDFVAQSDVDNLHGRISYACTQMAPRAPANGSGTALTLRFVGSNEGETFLSFEEALAATQQYGLTTATSDAEVVVVEPDEAPEASSPPTATVEETVPQQAATRTPRPTFTPASQQPTPTRDDAYPSDPTAVLDEPTATIEPYPEAETTEPTTSDTSERTSTPGPKGPPDLPTSPPEGSESRPSPPLGGTHAPDDTRAPTTTAEGSLLTDTGSPARPSPGEPQATMPSIERPTSALDAAQEAQPTVGDAGLTATPDKVAAIIATAGPEESARQRSDASRPLLPPEIFYCFSVVLVLFTALLIVYASQRHRGGSHQSSR